MGVSVVSPGYIRTNLSLNAVTGDGSKYGGETGWGAGGHVSSAVWSIEEGGGVEEKKI